MKAGKAFGAGLHAIRKTIPRFISIAKELAHELVGAMFFLFAVVFLVGPFGFVQNLRELPETMTRVLVSGLGALMFAWFSFDSFRRAKRLSRKR